VRAVPRLGELYPGICLTAEEKARKNLNQGSRRMPAGTMKIHNHTIIAETLTATRFSETSVVFDGYILMSLWILVVVYLTAPHNGVWRDKVKTRFLCR
jgi:hypothetical protein